MNEPLDSILNVRCRPEEVAEVRRLALQFDIGKSALARAALRAGLKVIKAQGIRPIESEKD